MKEKPILFSTPMIPPIQANIKTQTRRVIVPQPTADVCLGICTDSTDKRNVGKVGFGDGYNVKEFARPRYQPGDILWVRETWGIYADNIADAGFFEYRAGFNDETWDGVKVDPPKWRPSIHMPREAARIFLRVKTAQPQRLHAEFFAPVVSPIFTIQDEGIDIGDTCRECIGNYGTPCCIDTLDEDGTNLYGGECGMLDENRSEFAKLWDALNTKRGYGWKTNPWVWAYTFEQISEEAATRMEG